MELIRNIKNGSILVATNQDKLKILSYLSDNSIFLDLAFFDTAQSFSRINNLYPFYLNNEFKIKPYLSERFKKYFDYIDLDKNYKNEKIINLQQIKQALINSNIFIERKKTYPNIYSVNEHLIPSFLTGNLSSVFTSKTSEKDVVLYQTKNPKEQVYFVFDQVCGLLEKGVNIDQINILNSNDEDDLNLTKLFKDAKIPYNINKNKSLLTYPIMLDLLKILNSFGYDEAKNYLLSCENNDIVNKIIRAFNAYESSLVKKDIETFIYEIKKLSFNELTYQKAINIIAFQNNVFRNDEYYILMNYYDDYFPKKYLDNDYLSDEEVKLIRYPTSYELNMNQTKMTANILNQIDNLILGYPLEIIDETRPSRLRLERTIVVKDYENKTGDISYLDDMLYLDYAKKRYDYFNYNLLSEDLIKLNNIYKTNYKRFVPYFTGIDKEVLSKLLTKNRTLTAYKLEAFNLCPFKYYLNYLLRLDNFEENIYTFIGNVIHKALELKLKQEKFDLEEVFKMYSFPKSEEYKFEIFKEIIIENVAVITNIVKEFEENSEFKTVLSEEKIYQKFNDDFYLSGVIDKVMIDEKTKYFLIIDYKYSDKDYKRDDLNKEYRLQLPFYLMSYQKAHLDLKPAGMLYQKTSLAKEEKNVSANYKLKGMVIDLVAIVERIDPSFSQIQGVKLKKDGSLRDSPNNIISEIELTKQIFKMEQITNQVSQKILLGDFSIKPILTDKSQRTNNSISCEYCNYSSICYSKNKLLGGE